MEIVGIILGIAVLVILIISLVAQDSDKKTKKEKYSEAVGQVAYSAADTIAGIAHDILEPESEKELRLAREALADRNGRLYRFERYSEKERIKELLCVYESCIQNFVFGDTLSMTRKRFALVLICKLNKFTYINELHA